jgi:transposase
VLVGVLRAPALRQPPAVEAAYGSVVSTQVVLIAAMSEQIDILEADVGEHFGRHPDAEIYLSQPGLGKILGARVLAEFGDDPGRYADARARKNYSGQSPVTRASGLKKVVLARYARNRRLSDALHR